MADGNNEPGPFTAAALVQRLRGPDGGGDDDDDDEELRLNHRWYRRMQTWTDEEFRHVIEAAERCTAAWDLHFCLFRLEGRAAVLVSLILAQLNSVRSIRVQGRGEDEGYGSPPGAVDIILRGIMKSYSEMKCLMLDNCVCDPIAFLEFCAHYRGSLQGLCIECTPTRHDAFSAFASAVAMSWGSLASLRYVALDFRSFHSSVPPLLSTLNAAPAVEALDFVVHDDGSKQSLRDVALLCGCTNSTLQRLRVHGHESEMDSVNMYSVFDVGFPQPFSASIKEVQFLECAFWDDDMEGMELERAATALRHTEFLRLGSCRFPSAFTLVERIPRLKRLSIVSRNYYFVTLHDSIIDDDEHFETEVEEVAELEEDNIVADSKRVLGDNNDLLRLCQVIRRQESALNDIELDLVCRGAGIARSSSLSYPAMYDLLRCCRGRLILNCVRLPWECHQHVVAGLRHLSVHLKDLRLRFIDCALDDTDYAKIIRTLCTNRTLTMFEIWLGTTHATLDSSMTAIRDLVNTNTTLQALSLRGVGVNAPAILDRILPVLTDTNRTLRILNLRNADMANRWPDLLGRFKAMLQLNHVFSVLEGFDLPTDDPVASQVQELLELNWYGRRYWTADDLFTKRIWATVLEGISNDNDHQVLYKFLRAKPLGERPRGVGGVKRPRPVDDEDEL